MVWYAAGEGDIRTDPARARARFARALELAERCGGSFITGVAGTSSASIDARIGDPAVAAVEYRRLIGHWRRAGAWSTQWTMLRWVAVVVEKLGRVWEAAVLVGAVLATPEGNRIFGDDEVLLGELRDRLRAPSATRPTSPPSPKAACSTVTPPSSTPSRRCSGRRTYQRGESAATPSTVLPTISWVMASLPGWKPPHRTSR